MKARAWRINWRADRNITPHFHSLAHIKAEGGHYTGKNIGISMDAECDTSGTVCDNYFSVELHRNTFPFSTYIGSEGFKRNGYTEAVWTNVGEGDYFFKFVKCNNGKWVSSDSVRMFSY